MAKKRSDVVLSTERDVLDALEQRFAPPSWAIFFGVANGVGRERTRTADALAMGLWPSRGLLLVGIEVKVSRKDWQRELKKPAKAEAVAQYCDHWYIAAGSVDIVREGELPPTWGLLVPDASRQLRVAVEPTQLDPQPIDRSFLAALLRRVHERFAGSVPRREIGRVTAEAYAEAERMHREISDKKALGKIEDLERHLVKAKAEIATLRALLDMPLRQAPHRDLYALRRIGDSRARNGISWDHQRQQPRQGYSSKRGRTR